MGVGHTRLLLASAPVLALGCLAGCNLSRGGLSECAVSADCDPGELCLDGRCVPGAPDGGEDAPPDDAGNDGCLAVAESCNEVDDDCDGRTDEGPDGRPITETDPLHCGGCGDPCSLVNAVPGCEGGSCTVASCTAGFDDCDDIAATGCEADLGSSQSCGRCGHDCGADVCMAGGFCPRDPMAVAAGGTHACVVRRSGRVDCWGSNDEGELGDGTMVSRAMPGPVTLPGPAVALSAADAVTCTVVDGGRPYCWGMNDRGQAGQEGGAPRLLAPAILMNVFGATDVVLGPSHGCAIKSPAGELACWGTNNRGQLARGSITPFEARPGDIAGLTMVTGAAAGLASTCAVFGTGAIQCTGRNSAGQLADGTILDRNRFVDSRLAVAAAAADAGEEFACALTSAGDVHCWGRNQNGQLGVAPTAPGWCTAAVSGPDFCSEPLRVAALADVTAIAAGERHACAVAGAERALLCWGANDEGQLGDGTLVSRADPRPVLLADGTALESVDAVSAGRLYTCAIAGIDLYCWGANARGQLGLGDFTTRTRPTAVP